jgi:hypothetical protein
MLKDKEKDRHTGLLTDTKKNQKNKKKDKKFSEMIYVDDPRSHDDFLGESTDLYIYDIPKTLNRMEIETILKSFGKVKSYQYKRLHKYQLIRVELFPYHELLDYATKWTDF